MISRFFIDRPIFANVIAVLMVLFGVVAIFRLPVEQYPAITPPTVVVTTNYPGANAQVVADTVAAPIEQQINGVENMMYMSSTSSADGSYSLTITFEIGTNLDNAQVLVQNRLAVATPTLPEEVRQQGVTVKKQASNIIMAISLTSPPPEDQYDLAFDPAAVAARGLPADAVAAAVAREQGTTAAAPDKPAGYVRAAMPKGYGRTAAIGAQKLRDLAVAPGVPLSEVCRVAPAPPPFDGLFLSNYANLSLRDDLSRVKGVGDVSVRGVGAYSMRVWFDPDKLAARRLDTADVLAALRRQNVQVAAGQVGQSPNPSGQAFTYTVTTLGRLDKVQQFEDVVLRSGDAGQVVYLRDVAKVELGAQSYDSFSSRTGREAANLLVYQLPGSNAIQVADAVKAAMDKAVPNLPQGVVYDIPFNTTKFVNAAIHEVYLTLFEAGVLVLVVILVFLQSWRALLVPATTVPVTIIGAFAFMALLGFSVNLLTLFGVILSIGIVVDDAIVIVENASHHIEKGLAPREATIKAMGEVTGPVVAITLVLLAVFVPTAFLAGITGQMYRQFALTIAATALLSAVNALTLKPAQCARFLKPHTGRNFFTKVFDFVYRPAERAYAWVIRGLVKVWWVMLLLFVLTAVGTGWWYSKTPTGFLPAEDQGYVIVAIQLPDSASLDRTREVVDRLNAVLSEYAPKAKGENDAGTAENWFVLGGFSLLDGTNTSNSATAFIAWTDWSKRKSRETAQEELVKRIQGEFGQMQEAFILVIVPPAIQGLGVAGGFKMQVEDRGGVGADALAERTQALLADARQHPQINAMRTNSTYRPGVPQIYLDIDREKAEKMGVKMNDVFATIQANLGSVYVNDFNKFDRTYQVRVQADAAYRGDTSVIGRLEVPGRAEAPGGPPKRVPLSTLLTTESRIGPQAITRYNLYPTASINGSAAPGVSSGEAIKVMEQAAQTALPDTMGFEWTDIAFQEKRVGSDGFTVPTPWGDLVVTETIRTFALAVVLVYLVLAAQYESWLLPLAVILVVPLGLLGVVAAVNIRTMLSRVIPGMAAMDNNVYTQIGVVLIIALASKNAILIVEYARELRLAGRSIREAAVEAARMRFRPILMTSIAFILGVVPLVFAEGAAAASRQSLGTAVFGGMITATVLAIFFVPAFYVAVQGLIEMIGGPPKPLPGEKVPEFDDAPPERDGKPDAKPPQLARRADAPPPAAGS